MAFVVDVSARDTVGSKVALNQELAAHLGLQGMSSILLYH